MFFYVKFIPLADVAAKQIKNNFTQFVFKDLDLRVL